MATAGDDRGTGPERAYAPDLPAAGRVVLDSEESAHLVRSRRARVGDGVVLFDGRGGSRRGRLVVADPRGAVVDVEGPYPDRLPAREVRLAVSLPEAGRADRLVGALAEMGVSALAPLSCARTPGGREALGVRRASRWARLTREAAKVNGCSRLLVIEPLLTFEAALGAGAVLLDPDPAAAPLLALLGGTSATPWLLVGPEGGFDPREREQARQAGAPSAQVGPLALRTETAALSAAALALAP